MKVLIFGGTSDATYLIAHLKKMPLSITLSITSEYGGTLYNNKDINLIIGRKDISEITMLFNTHDIIIDATHPFALVISNNIKLVSKALNKEYLTLIRDDINYQDILMFNDLDAVVSYLADKEGNILSTTGSKLLEPYTKITNYQERLYVRVLPMIESIQACLDNNIKNNHIIALQGPFSESLNEAMYQQYKIKYLISKDSGTNGGLLEKINSAKKANVIPLIIKRPNVTGYNLNEIVVKIKEELRCKELSY